MAFLDVMVPGNQVRESLLIGCCSMADGLALLRAMADKLVPGIPHATRIAILQQTDADTNGNLDPESRNQHATVLEWVMGSDTSRNEVIRKMECKVYSYFYISILTYPVFKTYPKVLTPMIRPNRSAQFVQFVTSNSRVNCSWLKRTQA